MLFQITTAGNALLASSPQSLVLTSVKFGDQSNYVPLSCSTGIAGNLVFTTTPTTPLIQNTNTISYTAYMDTSVGTFNFGEVAFYAGSTLVALGVNSTTIAKLQDTGDVPGNIIQVTLFITQGSGNFYGVVSIDNSTDQYSLPNVEIPDLLFPPGQSGSNSYVVRGIYSNGELPYIAFADADTGLWSFTNRPVLYYSGTISSQNSTSVNVSADTGIEFTAAYNYVIQFTSGVNRGYVRQLSGIGLNQFSWGSPLNINASVGDTFDILGPALPVIAGATELEGLVDVNFPTDPTQGQVLTFNTTTSQWENHSIPEVPSTDLTDFSTTPPNAAGQVPIWNGTEYVPGIVTFVGNHNSLSGLQGGDSTTETYYHLSQNNYNSLIALIGEPFVFSNVATEFTAPVWVQPLDLTFSSEIATDLSKSNSFRLVLTGNTTVNAPVNQQDGLVFRYIFIQDASGSRTVTWDPSFQFANQSSPVLSTTPNAVDILDCYCDVPTGLVYAMMYKTIAAAPASYLPLTGGNVTGQIQFSNSTASTSTTTGAVVVTGGVGVGGALNVEGSVTVAGQLNAEDNLYVTGVIQATGKITAGADPSSALDVVTLEYMETYVTNFTESYLPLAGGTVSGVTTFSNATESTSDTVGAVVITGGLGVAKQLQLGTNLVAGGNGSFGGTIHATGNGSVGGTFQAGGVITSGGDPTNALDVVTLEYFNAHNAVPSGSSGYMPTTGGNFTGPVTVSDTTESSSTTTGSLILDGGLGMAKALYVGETIHSAGKITAGADPTNAFDVVTLEYLNTALGNYLLKSGGTITGPVVISSTVDSTNDATGALIVDGGVGISKTLEVGNAITAGGLITGNDGLVVSAGGINVQGTSIFQTGPTIAGAAGTTRLLTFGTGTTSPVNRFQAGLTSDTEGGSNAGSNYAIYRYSDSGSEIDAPFIINREFGQIAMHGAFTPAVSIASSATPVFDCSQSNVFVINGLATSITGITMSNPGDGQTVNIYIKQDGTGGRTITYPSTWKTPGGGLPALSTGANAIDRLTLTYSATLAIWDVVVGKALS